MLHSVYFLNIAVMNVVLLQKNLICRI